MIEPELCCNGKGLPASNPLGGGQKNLFLHADVTKQPGSKLIIRSLIDRPDLRHSRLQQSFQSPVVFDKKVCDRAGLFVLSRFHPLPPCMRSIPINISACGRGDVKTSIASLSW